MIVKLELPNARTTNGRTAYITMQKNKKNSTKRNRTKHNKKNIT